MLEALPFKGWLGFRAALLRAGERLHMDVQTGPEAQDVRRVWWGMVFKTSEA